MEVVLKNEQNHARGSEDQEAKNEEEKRDRKTVGRKRGRRRQIKRKREKNRDDDIDVGSFIDLITKKQRMRKNEKNNMKQK